MTLKIHQSARRQRIKQGECHFKDEADGYGLLIPDIDLDLNSATNSVENWDGGKHYMIIVL